MYSVYRRVLVLIAILATASGCPSTGGRGGGGTAGRLLLGGALIGATVAFAGVRGPSGGRPPNRAAPVDQTLSPELSGVAACASGNYATNLEIVNAFKDSMHELVVCGGMAQRFSISFFNTLVNLARGTSTRPEHFTHLGNGRYQVGDVMIVSMQWPFDTSVGSRGAPIEFDLFDSASYFADAEVVIKARSEAGHTRADLSVRFRERRPLLELLGDLVPLDNQFKLDFDAVVKVLGAVMIRQEIDVHDERGHIDVAYRAVSDGVPIRDLVFAQGSGTAPLEILGARAENKQLGQVLTITDWGMAFAGGASRTIDGHVTFEVTGGDFNWGGKFVYPHRSEPDITLWCR